MTTFFRKGDKPSPLPDVFVDDSGTSYTNLYSLSEEQLNSLGFYKGADAPVLSDLFHYFTDWSIQAEQWEVYERVYEDRLSIFTGMINDNVNQWRKIQRTFELQLLTGDYETEADLQTLKDSIAWVKTKIKSLENITYRNWQEPGVDGIDSDRDYNPEAFNFMDNEPEPSFGRVGS